MGKLDELIDVVDHGSEESVRKLLKKFGIENFVATGALISANVVSDDVYASSSTSLNTQTRVVMRDKENRKERRLARDLKSMSTNFSALMGKRVDINAISDRGTSVLHTAALKGYRDICNVLMDHGAFPNIRDTQGNTPMHLAAWNGHETVVEALAARKGSVVENSNNGSTPLHMAAQYGKVGVVRLLLKYGASALTENVEEETALDLACQYGRLDVVHIFLTFLRTRGLALDSNLSLMPKHTPLHLAAKGGHHKVLDLLLKPVSYGGGGMNVNVVSLSGTALHNAALYCKLEAVKILIRKGIDVDVVNTDGQTALDVLYAYNAVVTPPVAAVEEELQRHSGSHSSNAIYDRLEFDKTKGLRSSVDDFSLNIRTTPNDCDFNRDSSGNTLCRQSSLHVSRGISSDLADLDDFLASYQDPEKTVHGNQSMHNTGSIYEASTCSEYSGYNENSSNAANMDGTSLNSLDSLEGTYVRLASMGNKTSLSSSRPPALPPKRTSSSEELGPTKRTSSSEELGPPTYTENEESPYFRLAHPNRSTASSCCDEVGIRRSPSPATVASPPLPHRRALPEEQQNENTPPVVPVKSYMISRENRTKSSSSPNLRRISFSKLPLLSSENILPGAGAVSSTKPATSTEAPDTPPVIPPRRPSVLSNTRVPQAVSSPPRACPRPLPVRRASMSAVGGYQAHTLSDCDEISRSDSLHSITEDSDSSVPVPVPATKMAESTGSHFTLDFDELPKAPRPVNEPIEVVKSSACSNSNNGISTPTPTYAELSANVDTRESIEEWLLNLHLQRYLSDFLAVGYDSVPFLGAVDAGQIVKDVGISLPGHKKKLMLALEKLAPPTKLRTELTTVHNLLEFIGLLEYENILEENGYDDLSFFEGATHDDLAEVGIEKVGHRCRLLTLLS